MKRGFIAGWAGLSPKRSNSAALPPNSISKKPPPKLGPCGVGCRTGAGSRGGCLNVRANAGAPRAGVAEGLRSSGPAEAALKAITVRMAGRTRRCIDGLTLLTDTQPSRPAQGRIDCATVDPQPASLWLKVRAES